MSSTQTRLEVIEVAHGRLTAGRGMMGTKNRISMLRVDLRDSFNFFRVLFFFFTLKFINIRMHWLLMKHVNMVNSLAKIKVELMNLLLEKLNDSVALDNESITLNNLFFSMLNGFFQLSNYLFLGCNNCLKFLNPCILPANLIMIPLGYIGQSIDTVLLKYLVALLCIHKSDCSV
jgi:hypothetical protein